MTDAKQKTKKMCITQFLYLEVYYLGDFDMPYISFPETYVQQKHNITAFLIRIMNNYIMSCYILLLKSLQLFKNLPSSFSDFGQRTSFWSFSFSDVFGESERLL